MGFSYLNEILQQENKLRGLSFRPLTGTLLSKQIDPMEKSFKEFVSVPSRGLSYLNFPHQITQSSHPRFRPLTGTLLSKLAR